VDAVINRATSSPAVRIITSPGQPTSRSYSTPGPTNGTGSGPGSNNLTKRSPRGVDHPETLRPTSKRRKPAMAMLSKAGKDVKADHRTVKDADTVLDDATPPADGVGPRESMAEIARDPPTDAMREKGTIRGQVPLNAKLMANGPRTPNVDIQGVDLRPTTVAADAMSIRDNSMKETCETASTTTTWYRTISNSKRSKSSREHSKELKKNQREIRTQTTSQNQPNDRQQQGVDLHALKRRKNVKSSVSRTDSGCPPRAGLAERSSRRMTPPGSNISPTRPTKPRQNRLQPRMRQQLAAIPTMSNPEEPDAKTIRSKMLDLKQDLVFNNILFWNCSNGLLSKLAFVKEIISNLSPYLFFISESELKNEDQVKACNIKNYTLHVSKGLDMGKARTCCYLKDGLDFVRLSHLECYDSIVLESRASRLRVLGFYKPFTPHPGHSQAQIESDLRASIGQSSITEGEFVAGGDMNVDLLKQDSKALSLVSWLSECGLNQHVNDITRYRVVKLSEGNSSRVEKSLIDHVYSNKENQNVKLIPTEFSDHDILCVERRLSVAKPQRRVIKIRDWKGYSKDGLVSAVESCQVNLTPENYASALDSAFNKLVPLVSCRLKEGQIACAGLEKMKKKRNRLLTKFKRSGDKEYLLKARTLNRKLKKEFKKRTREIIQVKATSGNPKTFWATVGNLLGNNSSRDIILKEKEGMINDPSTLSARFLDFFVNKVYGLSNLATRPMDQIVYEPPRPLTFTEDDLINVLKEVKNKKCSGIDNVPLLVAKDFVSGHLDLALRIFNNAAISFPTPWRTARVLPLHKKGSKTDINNFRPISNLVSISKIYEKLLLRKLSLETDGEEGDSQHGFRKNFSTTTAVLELQSIIAKALDSGKVAAVYSVDLSAAFDLLRMDVFDRVMSDRLSPGLRHCILQFLDKRKIQVEVSGTRSQEACLELGCVQGSSLGPRLFTLYTSQISQIIKADGFVSYADDSYVVIIEDDLEVALQRIEQTSAKHVEYLESLGMKINTTKTEVVFFNKKQEIITDVKFAGVIVKSQPTLKALGVTFDYKLSWETHIRQTAAKANRKLSVLQKIRKFFTQKQFLQILTSQFFSVLFYCSQAWLTSATKRTYWSLINSVHYRALRVAMREFRPKTNREKIDVICQRASPKQWSKYAIASSVIKCISNGQPVLLVEFIKETLYIERRSPGIGKFYDNSKGKIGKQKLGNNLSFMNAIKDDWLGLELDNDRLRRILKKTYFSYLTRA
jgi:hypothetical protein